MNTNTTTTTTNNIIIVGAGLSGLALSIGLSNLGYNVTIIEIRKDFTNKGSTFGLRINGENALNELCLLGSSDGDDDNNNNTADIIETTKTTTTISPVIEKLHKHGIQIPGNNVRGLMLTWHTVRDALLEEVLKRKDQITIHMGYDILKDIDNGTEHVKVTFYNSSTNDDITISGCLLIGCDGINSIIRTKVLQLPQAQSSGVMTWRGCVSSIPDDSIVTPLLEKGITPLSMLNYGPVIFTVFNFHSKIPKTITWSASMKITTDTEDTKNIQPNNNTRNNVWDCIEPYITDEINKEYIKEIFNLSNIDDLTYVLDLRTINPNNNNNNNQWGNGRIVLVGDAVHAMRPASGFGGSMAFEDCIILCREIHNAIIQKEQNNDDDDNNNNNNPLNDINIVNEIINKYQSIRNPRVCKIWQTEWDFQHIRKVYNIGNHIHKNI